MWFLRGRLLGTALIYSCERSGIMGGRRLVYGKCGEILARRYEMKDQEE